jgi:hypothetical protein
MPILLPAHSSTAAFTLDEFNKELNKAALLPYFTRVSGTGTLTYNSAVASSEGKGRLEFSGIGRWELIVRIPVNESKGIGFRATHQQATGAATVAIGINCKDANLASLGDRNSFFTGATPAGLTNLQTFVYLAGATVDTYISGTRFATFFINITANTGVYVIDRPYIESLSFAQKALYV